ncbi:MAG TPA: DUF2442 domain-containing protein [Spirochaetota bacterium]|jgi:hypothetical protein|nr:DUF2442 domain-containing protein [Spirochaetota bacterium]HNU91804.1 DUF2442 domain-containing protein [Spirochaetota bacterium]HPI14861.1 DUF2442 domain-containing protein [Spirochaetota bacterium]HPO45398.1 DUF2442 domain-containing protein [Spirochaetota bacterium]HPV98970.1 DUF2442 domain-containing protein [Spirochaetota bacterium]
MNSLESDARAQKVWLDDYNLWVQFTDGRVLSVPLAYFPRLRRASGEQRNKFEMSGGGFGLHWDELDEDISVPHLLLGRYDRVVVQAGARGVGRIER